MENEHVFAPLYGQLHRECAQSIKPELCWHYQCFSLFLYFAKDLWKLFSTRTIERTVYRSIIYNWGVQKQNLENYPMTARIANRWRIKWVEGVGPYPTLEHTIRSSIVV